LIESVIRLLADVTHIPLIEMAQGRFIVWEVVYIVEEREFFMAVKLCRVRHLLHQSRTDEHLQRPSIILE
jgi:hypothetical protein